MKIRNFNSIGFKIRIVYISFIMVMAVVMKLFSAPVPEEVKPEQNQEVYKIDKELLSQVPEMPINPLDGVAVAPRVTFLWNGNR